MTTVQAGSARIIDGSAVAKAIREEVKGEASALAARGVQPGLAVVLVGDDPASAVYVRSKGKACEEAGMRSETIRMPATTTQAELLAVVDRLNADPLTHGILVQMPLPKQIDPQAVILRIDPAKDVDGFHPVNSGKLFSGDLSGFIPCTPLGVRELLLRHGIETQVANAVVIGRSTIVGRPMAALLLLAGKGGDATVTVCHSRTRDLEGHLKKANIVIAAIGRREMITGDMLKPGAVVIDVGMNRVDDPTTKSGTRLYGDVHYPSASAVASWITPVPGGVGPMTIAMLLKNTITAATRVAAR
ncbi:MAG: bifunctional 5,10-methylenetetrahydrofolate dehydrogenase/5,10-methenyltetrahydrofolate cyclohydrolase [Gemmatimonadetes bacterium]|nr:bifunctional 5,10-methylenetetrahydrofolate dehydrogenase/5,10-methenyltetrahydrofolate cyclohydrolase [Gemmatimonadota bacterium]